MESVKCPNCSEEYMQVRKIREWSTDRPARHCGLCGHIEEATAAERLAYARGGGIVR